MRVFTEHKIEWLIGLTCAFLPIILTRFISATSSIPDVTIPFWLVVLIITVPLGIFAARAYGKKIKTVANKTYGVEQVKICGKHFANCKFNGTELVFDGTAITSMDYCDLSNQRITFSGGASITVNYFIALYSDPAFRPIVEQT